MHRHALVPAALAAAALSVLALSGCSGIEDALQHQVSGTYASRAALAHAWSTPASEPSWIPADATALRAVAATGGGGADETPAIVRVRSSSALPASCTRIERRSMDPFSVTWAPERIPARVERCGNWAVIAVPGGYYGWTPLTAAERTAPAA